MSGLETLVSALGLSFASGVNLYATVLVVGLAQTFGWLPFLPDDLEVLSHPAVLWTAGVLYLIEFVADKVPFLTPIWDGFHTFIRPVGAAALAVGTTEEWGLGVQLAAALAGGTVALGSHSTKAGARLLAHTAPEPVTHTLISLAEDAGVIGLLTLVFTYPWAALGVLIALIAGMALILPVIVRSLRFVLRSAGGAVSRAFGAAAAPPAPPWLEKELDPAETWTLYRGFSRSGIGLPLFAAGYLCVSETSVRFARQGLFGSRGVELGRPGELSLERRFICDLVTAERPDGRMARVCLPKDQSSLLRRQQPSREWVAAAG